jgi:hypothetical protein
VDADTGESDAKDEQVAAVVAGDGDSDRSDVLLSLVLVDVDDVDDVDADADAAVSSVQVHSDKICTTDESFR